MSTVSLWKAVRMSAQLVYISPEMALSNSFSKLWKDANFRKRLQAIVVDEAHCIDEWGKEFRPQYRELSQLRHYTSQDVPFVSCTATCTSKTFNIIWHSLGYGHRPFWGIDMGSRRPNLVFLTHVLENVKNPVLDILNILPEVLDTNTQCEAINKSLFILTVRRPAVSLFGLFERSSWNIFETVFNHFHQMAPRLPRHHAGKVS